MQQKEISQKPCKPKSIAKDEAKLIKDKITKVYLNYL